MPPKRKAQAAVSESGSGDDVPKKKVSKKPAKEPLTPLDPTLPNNKTFPMESELQFAKKGEGITRLGTWNVCGIVRHDCVRALRS